MRGKRIAALLLSGVMAASMLTGCGSVDKNAVVATLDDKEITLGVANFAARLTQAQYDDFYVSYFGEEIWQSDLYGDGSTTEDYTKSDVMSSLQDMYVLQAHMDDYGVTITEEEQTAISEAAAAFISSNSQEALDALGATQEIVEEYLTLVTTQYKMYAAIIEDADTNVSDEEANMSAYSYVRVSTTTYTDADGNSVEYTEEEQDALADTMAGFVTDARKNTLETTAEALGYSVYTGTFSADDTTLDEAVLTALKGLEEGEIADLINTGSYYYIVRLDAKTDAAATESNRQSIIEQRQSDLYTEVLDGWIEASEWTVDEKVWEQVTFDNLFTTIEPSTETETAETTEAE